MSKTDFEAELLSALHMIVNALEQICDNLTAFDGEISGALDVEVTSLRI